MVLSAADPDSIGGYRLVPLPARGGEGPVCFGTSSGRFVALDQRTGGVLWRTGARGDEAMSSYAGAELADDALYGQYGYDRLVTFDVNRPEGGREGRGPLRLRCC